MLFAKIIEEAGFKSCRFPRSSSIPITLYDGKDRVLETAHYSKKLFAENTKSAVDFFSFLNYLEQQTVSSFNVKVDEFSVTAFYGTEQSISFKRNYSMDPLDYME